MKNPNKYGTVYKLSGKRRRPYIARAYNGKNELGKSVYITIGYYKTKTEAKTALANYNSSPYDIANSKLTFKEVFNLFREDHIKYININTFKNNYQTVFNNALKPLHYEKFNDLRPIHYQRIIDKYAKTHKKSYLKKIKILLGLIYKFAIVQDICIKDYSKGVRITGIETAEQEYMTQNEVITMINNLDIVKDTDIVLLLCLTGLRPSELLNIKKDNIDFTNGIIHDIGIKTDAGRGKRVPISKIIKPYLLDRYNKADNYLFTNARGYQLTYSGFLYKIYKPVLKSLKIDYKSPKACRHFLATISKQQNVNDKVRINILGHTQSDFTDEVYTHIQDNFNISEYEKIDNYLQYLTKE